MISNWSIFRSNAFPTTAKLCSCFFQRDHPKQANYLLPAIVILERPFYHLFIFCHRCVAN